MNKLAIFDCDGTLVDSGGNIFAALSDAFGEHGVAVPPQEVSRRVIGLSLVEAIATLGTTGSERIDGLVHDLVESSARAGEIVQGAETAAAMSALREFMFDRIYLGEEVRVERARIASVLRALFEHYMAHSEELPEGGDQDLATAVVDYIAGMTDRFCVRRYTELRVPRAFSR